MRPIHNGRPPLLIAPALALTATLTLVFLTGRPGPVALWGGLAVLVSAVPLVVPWDYLRPAVWMCAALVTVLVIIAGASIGLFYSPVVIALPLGYLFTCAPDDEFHPHDEHPRRDAARDWS
jgi:hypothetical protein